MRIPRGVGWFVHCFRHFEQFSGRASRPEFWWFQFITLGITLVIGHFIAPLRLVWQAIITIPHLAVTSRRLHDANYSLAKVIPAYAVAITLVLTRHIVPTLSLDPNDARLLSYAVLVLAIASLGLFAALAVLLCKRGTSESNRFGPLPPSSPT